jgi:hypothetical protein
MFILSLDICVIGLCFGKISGEHDHVAHIQTLISEFRENTTPVLEKKNYVD